LEAEVPLIGHGASALRRRVAPGSRIMGTAVATSVFGVCGDEEK
jgi:hypothetical protein